MSFQTFLTRGFIVAIIIFILFAVFGAGGGFAAAFNLGKITAGVVSLMAQIPIWFWLVVAMIWLVSQMRK